MTKSGQVPINYDIYPASLIFSPSGLNYLMPGAFVGRLLGIWLHTRLVRKILIKAYKVFNYLFPFLKDIKLGKKTNTIKTKTLEFSSPSEDSSHHLFWLLPRARHWYFTCIILIFTVALKVDIDILFFI